MWWAVVWLGIGFALKWIKETWLALISRWTHCITWIGQKMKQAAPKVYDLLTLALSFYLVYASFGILHVTTWQAFIIFVFWSFVLVILRAE